MAKPVTVGVVFAFSQVTVRKDEDIGITVGHAVVQFQFIRQFPFEGDLSVPEFFLQTHPGFE